jgi:hypothetical protein
MTGDRHLVREALAHHAVTESIGRRLGDDLISAARELISAWHQRANCDRRIVAAITKLEKLVGGPDQ